MHPSRFDAKKLLARRNLIPALLVCGLFFAAVGEAVGQEAAAGSQLLQPDPATGGIYLEEAAATEELLRELELERGKSVLVRTSYQVKRVSVGNPALLDVVVLNPREIQLVAKNVGSTNVLIWDSKNQPQASIEVLIGTSESYLQRELRSLLESPEIRVDSAGGATVLRGRVSSAIAAEQAMAVARAYAGEDAGGLVNLLEVGGNQQVMLHVVIAEMSRTITREFGTNFNALIDAGNGAISISGMLGGLTSPGLGVGDPVLLSDAINLAAGFFGFGGLDALGVFLDILDERGLTKVLAQPTLVARSGESANFLVGGEIPIPIAQGGAFGSITVEYKPFGVGLNFTPTVMSPDRIHLQVAPEVSRPDFTFGTEVSGTIVPAFNSRRASTSVELKHGQSLMMAGLLNEDLREQVSQYPILGSIPVIGGLFRSSQFQKNYTELVIIVTPTLVDTLGPGPHPLPTDTFVEPSALEFYLFGWLEGRPPAPEEPAGLIGEAGYRISPTVKESTNE